MSTTLPSPAKRPVSPAFPALPAYAQAVIDDASPIMLLWWARACLKTTTVARKVVLDRLTGRAPRDCIYTTVNEENGREFLHAVKRDLELAGRISSVVWGTEVIDGVEVRVGSVEFPRVGGHAPRVKFISGNPAAFRGLRGDLIFDEVGFVADVAALLSAAAGCAAVGGTLIMMTSGITEGGAADQVLEMGRRAAGMPGAGPVRPGDMPVSLHCCTIDRAIEEGVVEYLCHVSPLRMTRQQWRAHCRQFYLTEQQWQEETGCVKRRRSESMYLPPSMIEPLQRGDDGRACGSPAEFVAVVDETARRLSPEAVFAGYDIARRNHLSVVAVAGKLGPTLRTLGVLRMRDTAYAQQIEALKALMRRDDLGRGAAGNPHGLRVRRLCVDATGMGGPLGEELARLFPTRAEAVTITAPVKSELMGLLRKHAESGTLTIPTDPDIVRDFASVRAEVTASGNVRFVADETEGGDGGIGHADHAHAYALMLHAAESRKGYGYCVRTLSGADP